MMKVCIGLLLLFVFFGAGLIYTRRLRSGWSAESAIQYRATRELVKNHRIAATDLMPPPGLPDDLYWRLPPRSALENHYVCCQTIDTGKPVEASAVRELPVPVNVPKTRPFFYSLDGKPELAALLDPELTATVGDIQVTVAAVVCTPASDPAKAPACFALLNVPEDKAKDLWNENPLLPLIPKGY